MRLALTATCITTLATLLAAEARADTTISTATTAPVRTSTAGNISITADGSITPTAAGNAVTIDSNNTVTSAGKITFSGINDAAGIVAAGGFTSGITNSGAITLDETYTRTDTNADTVLDGPYAQGSNRYAIRIDGTTPFTGTLNNTGVITVRGNNSAGIFAAAPIVGNVTTNTGAITVTGNNDYGVRLGSVTGNVAISSAISMLGGNSTGLALTGNVTGQVVVHGSITTTGYSSTALPADVTKLTAENLQQGGSAMVVNGNVAGGVLIAAAPADTTNTTADVDKDGIADATQTTATFVTYGSAPSLLIGSTAAPVTLGVFSGDTNGLIINGKIAGVGVYSGISATGAQVGGLGAPVTVNGGIAVGGQIAGSANGAAAYGLRLGAGATTPKLTVTGSIGAGATATAGGSSVGVQIDAGATLPTIANSGTISAQTTAATGASTAILDKSGTLASVTNSGSILASSTDGTQRAIDASVNTTGFTYTQALATSTQTTLPALSGGLVTGSGNDVVSASAGVISSKMALGAGNDTIALSGTTAAVIDATLGDGNDNVTLSGTSSYSGSIDFGAGNNTLTIGTGSGFFGKFINTNGAALNAAVALNGGTLAFNTTDTSTMSSLNVSGGTIGVVLDPTTPAAHTLINVTGATTFTGPATLAVSLVKFGLTSGSTTVLQSGSLVGANNLSLSISNLPYLLKGSLATDATAGTVGVAIQRKTATELQLRRSEAASYDAVFSAIQSNTTLSTLFLGLTERDPTLLHYREMLPDHQGGVFDVLSEGSRALAPTENVTPWATLGRVSLWAQQALWDEHQGANDTPGNGGSGWGLTGGGDLAIGDNSRAGISIGYIHGDVRDSGANEVSANQFGGGLHWYSGWGGLKLTAYGSAGYVRLSETRSLSGATDTSPSILTSKGKWNGINAAAGAKASYEWTAGAFYLRPSALLTYNRLSESSHNETGGGAGFDLAVAKRTSSEAAATGMLAAGINFGNRTDPEATTLRLELEGGRRQILSSDLNGTRAHFTGGSDFTLLPEDRKSGWVGGANASLGSSSFRFIASGVVETRSNGQRIFSGRFGFRGSF
ncbi:autotransporter outer membrane beta-barrel domain-containing protein [Sphingomonas crusticola]|uniref:autotransporter outer membrane beta-barrel domain-containing protein n=1 Tax=Sphingomonas crusticola TaxID=1697973 RepID=UPI000E255721|nr:autotransporter outer membrane beta-barrel domain-containing protein [Sphingomonas crusticola]